MAGQLLISFDQLQHLASRIERAADDIDNLFRAIEALTQPNSLWQGQTPAVPTELYAELAKHHQASVEILRNLSTFYSRAVEAYTTAEKELSSALGLEP